MTTTAATHGSLPVAPSAVNAGGGRAYLSQRLVAIIERHNIEFSCPAASTRPYKALPGRIPCSKRPSRGQLQRFVRFIPAPASSMSELRGLSQKKYGLHPYQSLSRLVQGSRLGIVPRRSDLYHSDQASRVPKLTR